MSVPIDIWREMIPFIWDHYPKINIKSKPGVKYAAGFDIVVGQRTEAGKVRMTGLYTEDDEIVMYEDWRDERQGRINSIQQPPQDDAIPFVPVDEMDAAVFGETDAPTANDNGQLNMFTDGEVETPFDAETQAGINNQIGRNRK